MVYLSNKNLKEKKYLMAFGFKHCFFSSVFWKNIGFLFDTKLTLNFRGEGGGVYIYLALGQ